MDEHRCVLRLTLNLGPQSESYNQFHRYRKTHYPNDREFIFSFRGDDGIDRPMELGLDIFHKCAGASIRTFVGTMRQFLRQHTSLAGRLVVHIHHAGVGGLFHVARYTVWKRPGRVVYSMHNQFRRYNVRYQLMTAFNILLADRTVCVSQSAYDSLPMFLKRLRGDRIVYIRNGVDLDRVDQVVNKMQRQSGDSGERRLVTVGKMYPQKNYDFLFEVFADLSENYHLTVIGDGPDRPRLQSLARELTIDARVTFTGLIPREDVFQLLADSDIYLSAARWEGLPVAVLEAMAAHMPAIVSNIDPHREIHQHALALRLVDFDRGQWVEAIEAFASLADERLREIGRSNRRAVSAYFTLERMHDQYTSVYDDLLRSGGDE